MVEPTSRAQAINSIKKLKKMQMWYLQAVAHYFREIALSSRVGNSVLGAAASHRKDNGEGDKDNLVTDVSPREQENRRGRAHQRKRTRCLGCICTIRVARVAIAVSVAISVIVTVAVTFSAAVTVAAATNTTLAVSAIIAAAAIIATTNRHDSTSFVE